MFSTTSFFLATCLLLGISGWTSAFAPASQAKAAAASGSSTQLHLNFLQGMLGMGPTEAEITETVYFDIDIDGTEAGRVAAGRVVRSWFVRGRRRWAVSWFSYLFP